MKKLFTLMFIFAFAFLPVFSILTANAGTLDWAESVESFSQGNQKSGAAVIAGRSDPGEALGPNDGDFVSLGYGGELVLEFPTKAGGVLQIKTYEVTGGTYPLETAMVEVSDDGSDWKLIGEATNEEGQGDGITEFDLEEFCVKYIRLTDTTDSSLHDDSSDGYDVDAVSMEWEEECKDEKCHKCKKGNDIVINWNDAEVRNRVSTNANTGGNYADGSYGGDGGDGGDIRNNGGEVEGSTTGNGGQGATSSTGGTVFTGNANASTTILNKVNENRTTIDRCGCGEEEECDCEGRCDCDNGHVVVFNGNRARVGSEAATNANTGDNDADGSYGGDGGDGGDIENGYFPKKHGPKPPRQVNENTSNGQDGKNGENHSGDGEVEDSDTGNGASGGESAEGGLVETGEANSWTRVVNMINRNITRVRR